MKSKIRSEILMIRNQLDDSIVSNAEKAVFNYLIHTKIYQSAEYVMVYSDFKNEIKTKNIMYHILDHKKNLIVPLTNTNTFQIWPIQISSINELSPGNYGILEPPKNKIGNFDINLLDLVIVPGVAFDYSGNRIGFGKGYYDSFLSPLKGKAVFISLAYDFQVLDSIPSEKHDIKMDYIITPTKIINCKDN